MSLSSHDNVSASGTQIVSQILAWLALPPGDSPADDLDVMRQHLSMLRDARPDAVQLHKTLDALHARVTQSATQLIPGLFNLRLPISSATRRTARSLQDALELLAREYIGDVEGLDEHQAKGPRPHQDQAIWRAMHALNRHLFISDLLSAPPMPGIWQLIHQAMDVAYRLRIHQQTPEGVDCSVQILYQRTLLLGCAQSSAFTAHEWSCIEKYVMNHGTLLRLVDPRKTGETPAGFWLNKTEDMRPVACGKRPPSDSPSLLCFSCEALTTQLRRQHIQLNKGAGPGSIGFPEGLPTRLAKSLLRRLHNMWGDQQKRRFPRRRQGYRARLCFGFREIWEMLRGKAPGDADASEWLLTNESPDGYAAMHVSGKLHKVQIGDLIALRTADTAEWQICIVRWALSENPEHLELGLQVLAPSALPASLALRAGDHAERQPALLMPAIPPMQPRQTIATAPGLLMEDSGKLVLVVESGKIDVREIRIASMQEQSPDIDLLTIDPDRSL